MKSRFTYENRVRRQGFGAIAGVDEVGRGAWAGPLLAAAVIVPTKLQNSLASWIKIVNDSKLLSSVQREKIYAACRHQVMWAIGIVTNQAIDKYGVAWANRKAIVTAVSKLKPPSDYVLCDYVAGLDERVLGLPSKVLVDGDAKVFSIALASIIAKVKRDELMIKYAGQYPGYGFAQHKGYGTRQHAEAIKKLGPCPLHRYSYRPLKQKLAIL